MPYTKYEHQLITMRASDVAIDGTKMGQVIRFAGINHTQDRNGECAAIISVECTLYSLLEDGSLGGVIKKGYITNPRTVPLTADNQTLVDEVTGDITIIRNYLKSDGTRVSDAEFQLALDHTTGTMLQGDYFEKQRNEGPIDMRATIERYMQAGDLMGKYA